MTAEATGTAYGHLHADAVRELSGWSAPGDAQAQLRDDYLAHLAEHPDGVAKVGPSAHLTASCLVLDADRERVLLTLHRRARQWFQFGGHLEPSDVSLHAAAQREGREESGIVGLTARPGIVQLDRHTLVGAFGRCQEHLDVRYVAVADPGAEPATSPESLDVAWWPVDGLPEGTRAELTPLVDAALAVVSGR